MGSQLNEATDEFVPLEQSRTLGFPKGGSIVNSGDTLLAVSKKRLDHEWLDSGIM
jgi:hypothetical protein